MFFSIEEILFFSSVGRLKFLYKYRSGILDDETINASIAPGPTPNNRYTPVDLNDSQISHTHPYPYPQESATLYGQANRRYLRGRAACVQGLLNGKRDPHINPI